jgi:hypothetical protein
LLPAESAKSEILRSPRFDGGNFLECEVLLPDRPDFVFSRDRHAIVAVAPNPSGERSEREVEMIPQEGALRFRTIVIRGIRVDFKTYQQAPSEEREATAIG